MRKEWFYTAFIMVLASGILVTSTGAVSPTTCQACGKAACGQTMCIGQNQFQCQDGQWLLAKQNAPACGYVPVVKEVLTNKWEMPDFLAVLSSGMLRDEETKDLGGQKSVTLYSGGVSGGSAFPGGGVPGAAYVQLCDELSAYGFCEDYQIGLPLYSDITIPNVRYIKLVNTIAMAPMDAHVFAYVVISNVVYSTS